MKLSFTTMATPGYPLADTLKLAKDNNYSGVDLRISENRGELNVSSPDSDIYAVKGAFKENGTEISSLLCYIKLGKPNDPSSWQAMEDSIVENMEVAGKLECKYIRIFGPAPAKFPNPDDCLKQTAETITKALKRGAGPVSVLMQNHANDCNAGECVQLADMIADSRFGLVFSPDSCVSVHEDPEKAVPLVIPYAKQLYVADGLFEGEKFKHVTPGKGIISFKNIYAALGGENFEGYVTFKWEKIWVPDLDEAEIALPFFANNIKNILGL